MSDSKLGLEYKAALQAMKRFSLEQSAEESVNVNAESENTTRQACPACGTANRKGNNFCASCGATLLKSPRQADAAPATVPQMRRRHPAIITTTITIIIIIFRPLTALRWGLVPTCVAAGGAGREIVRVRAPLGGPSLSRAETALRKVAQDWALACNTKQLDDLVELYMPDALVQRPNVPAVRGTAAIREFFFGLLEAGMSEVELDPLRTELFGDFGYEAGRCKSLVPIAMGKRREERGKYLVLLTRQSNGEWRIVADSWSSDLSLGVGIDKPVASPLRPPGPAFLFLLRANPK